MKINFKKIMWKNFLSYGNVPVVIDLDATKTSILVGKSGAGKSSLLDALVFVLYNAPFRDSSKPNLVNWINKKDCLLEVEFEIGTNQYKVRRGIKPNIFEIYCNGALVNQNPNARDYQAYLEQNILKCNFKSFCQIVVVGIANFTPFMKLKAADRRLIVEELLDIQVFSVMNQLMKGKISDLKTAESEVDTELKLTEEKIKIYDQCLKTIEENQKKQSDELTAQVADLETQKTAAETLYNKEIVNRDEVQTKIADKLPKYQAFTKKLNDLKVKLDTQEAAAKKDQKFFESHENCPTCTQAIDGTMKAAHLASLTTKIASFVKAKEQLKAKFEDAEKVRQELALLQGWLNESEALCREHSLKKSLLVSRISNLKTEIEKLGNQPTGETEKAALLLLNEELGKKTETKKEIIIRKDVYDSTALLLKDNGIKAQIIKQYLPMINRNINRYLELMEFFIRVKLDSEFNDTIRAAGTDTYSYGSFSEGERQRIDLALLFTWRTVAKLKNSINTNLLIIDEVLDSSLDLAATENVLELLKNEVFPDHNIFVISHKDSITDKFDRSLNFVKDKKFTQMTVVARHGRA